MTGIAWAAEAPSAEDARLAEELGFDALVGSAAPGGAGPLAWVAPAAEATSRIELIAIATPILGAGPVALAREAAALAGASGGRLVLGVGTGDAEVEDPGEGRVVPNWERMGRLKEAISILRGLLRGEAVRHESPYHRVDARLDRAPTHPVPLWMLADGPSSAGMAARLCDGLLVEVDAPAAALADVVQPFRAAAPAGAPVLAIVREEGIGAAAGQLRPHRIAVAGTPSPEAMRRALDVLRAG